MRNKHIITIWENDMVEVPEVIQLDFIEERYPDYEIKMLSGLWHRDKEDIFASLEESRVIFINPNHLEAEQIVKLAQLISHPIWINFNSNTRNWDVRDFVFYSSAPFEDLCMVRDNLRGIKDHHQEPVLPKILACEAHFWGYAGEHYELIKERWRNGVCPIYAIRYT